MSAAANRRRAEGDGVRRKRTRSDEINRAVGRGRGRSRGDEGGVPGSREAAGNCGPKHNMPLHMANMGRVWLALHTEQPLDGTDVL